ncbi:MAG: response regulator [Ignavibacteriae bacterium]|nr:response regulator [Ignavibacteriota bacterium]
MKILVVDDNEGYLEAIGAVLKAYGYELLLAKNGKQAREFLEMEHVDLIISDVFMPTLDGVRFHSYVREFAGASETPFIFISGFDDPYTREAVFDSNIDFFFSKTTPIEELVAVIERFKEVRVEKSADKTV